ncbi:MAG: DNA mismatch repair endonuclease MutL [Desulfobacteraceae bacterium]
MAQVRILPEILSNQIAAGEVVERPFSVVKELVENALDAGSTQLHIEVENGGKNLIRISDNGSGMSYDDALLSVERYATSKLYENKDLFSIRTLGFRGEALPSIASVSRFTLITREKTADAATLIYMEGGKVKKVSEAGAPAGTMITVEQLFFNTPARRKFLKSTTTEMAHILDTLACIALGWPKVQFKVSHNGKSVKSWPQAQGFYDRAVDIMGQEFRNSLIPVEFNDDTVEITGLVSSPDSTRSGSQKLFLYVNGRYVRDRSLIHALLEAYGSRLMKQRYPVAVLFLTLPCDMVDVNVHPTKHEVRFAEHNRVYSAVKACVSLALSQREKTRHSESFTRRPETPFSISEKIQHKDTSQTGLFDETRFVSSHPVSSAPAAIESEVFHKEADFTPYEVPVERSAGISEFLNDTDRFTIAEERVSSPAVLPVLQRETPEHKNLFFSSLRIVGQLQNTYILCDSPEGLIIIDQHAAHERIVFETLKNKTTKFGSQTLLLPETVELGYKEAEALEKELPNLEGLGLDIEPFGQNCFVVKSVPAILSQGSVTRLVLDIAEKLVETGSSRNLENALDDCLIVMACHGAIRAHQILSEPQMKQLLAQLDACETPSFCPHGRPTWTRYSMALLEKAFKRV